MEKYNLSQDLAVFGVQVKSFPQGIGDAFDSLVRMLPQDDNRPLYGISQCTDHGVVYKAAALEKTEGEAEKYGCERYVVERGEYLTRTVMDWTKKTNSIRDVFDEMFKDTRSDRSKPCVEIYKNDTEMVCMVMVNKSAL